jgi:hypothetical protein
MGRKDRPMGSPSVAGRRAIKDFSIDDVTRNDLEWMQKDLEDHRCNVNSPSVLLSLASLTVEETFDMFQLDVPGDGFPCSHPLTCLMYPPFRVPMPDFVSNDALAPLKPLYNDMVFNDDNWSRIMAVLKGGKKSATFAALCFLWYPVHSHSCRSIYRHPDA